MTQTVTDGLHWKFWVNFLTKRKMEIPGFYYCPEKKRHFKIGPGFQPPKLKPKTLSELNPIERKRSTNLRKILTNRLVLNGKIPKNAFTEWTLKNERFKECFIKISSIHNICDQFSSLWKKIFQTFKDPNFGKAALKTICFSWRKFCSTGAARRKKRSS